MLIHEYAKSMARSKQEGGWKQVFALMVKG